MAIINQNQVAIIICSYNRCQILRQTLDSYFEHYPNTAAEIFVVDNNSNDNTKSICQEFSKHNLHYVFCKDQGLSNARNFGLKQTQRPIIIYIDDDVSFHEHWLENLIAPFEDEKLGAVGGELLPIWEVERPTWLEDAFLGYYSTNLQWSEELKTVNAHQWLCEANIAFSRQALIEAGGFSPKLGRIGPVLLSGEGMIVDIIRQNGWKIMFQPLAVLNHHIAKERLTKKWLTKRVFWQGITQSLVEDYTSQHMENVNQIHHYKNLRLPVNMATWQKLLQPDEDDNFATILQQIYDLGYAMQQAKLI